MSFVLTTNPTGNGVGPIQTPEEEYAKQHQQLVNDAGGSAIYKLANELGMNIDDSTRDYLYQYYLNEKSASTEWDRSVFAAKNQYQWIVEDLKKAGLNPFLALSGLNSATAQSSSHSVGGGTVASMLNNQKTNATNIVKTLLTALASIIGLAIFKK